MNKRASLFEPEHQWRRKKEVATLTPAGPTLNFEKKISVFVFFI
jgi:hypothetical protein